MQIPIKEGVTTSEFWLTLLTNLMALATLLGAPAILTNTQLSTVAQGAALVTSAVVTVVYTHQRSQIKKTAIETEPVNTPASPVATGAGDAT